MWCRDVASKRNYIDDPETLYIDIDEKYFTLWRKGVRYMPAKKWKPGYPRLFFPLLSPPSLFNPPFPLFLAFFLISGDKMRPETSKTKKKKVMFFAAIYCPRLDLGPEFDGKLHLEVAHPHKVLLFPFEIIISIVLTCSFNRIAPNMPDQVIRSGSSAKLWIEKFILRSASELLMQSRSVSPFLILPSSLPSLLLVVHW